MKALYLLLFSLLLPLYNSEECAYQYAENPEECHNIKYLTGYCCYRRIEQSNKGSTHDDRVCVYVKQTDYDNIKEYVDYHKKTDILSGWELEVYKIDCDSKYISYSLLLLSILLL